MRYLFVLTLIFCSFSLHADDSARNEILEALNTYRALENEALTQYFIDLSHGMGEQKARRKYYDREFKIRGWYYNTADETCLRYTNNKCRWD